MSYIKKIILMLQFSWTLLYFTWILLKMWFLESFSRIQASWLISSGWNFVFWLRCAQSLFETGQNCKKYKESNWKMQEYISESIEPPTNPQFLKSSGHVKWSLLNLRNVRKGKYCIIFIRKLEIYLLVPSRHPQQHISHFPKSKLSQDDLKS